MKEVPYIFGKHRPKEIFAYENYQSSKLESWLDSF